MGPSFAVWLFKLAARLPLSSLHRIGAMLGWLTYAGSGKYAAQLRENLRREYVSRPDADFKKVLNTCIAETGKSLVELPWVWRRPLAEVTGSVRECLGWEHVEAAIARGKGCIFLTPHLGCFEIAALYIGARMPITALYRPPKLAWLEPLMRGGRERGQVHLARTDASGVRALLKALKRGEAIGLLPDQVPGKEGGEWANFFGRPAYTMTLVTRLIEASDAAALMIHAERLPRGAGYVLRIAALELDARLPVTQQMNTALEQVVRACPAQYLWSYNRYKIPAGAELPESKKV
ncbi:MAG: lysophospholipid acyltransferase family protein [Nitrosomonadales bacterium]|nr:lysophospholipid acyltransferase family protein [Nitrosomonadales bacterium]